MIFVVTFCRGCGTENALIKIKVDMDSILVQGLDVLLILLDLSVVIDMVDPDILLNFFECVGLTGCSLYRMRTRLGLYMFREQSPRKFLLK